MLCVDRNVQQLIRALYRHAKAPPAFEAPCSTIFVDARQTEWYLREYTTYERPFDMSSSCQAPRPSPGPHKLRESLPLVVFLRNRLKYVLTGREVTAIIKQRLIKVDGKVRTDTLPY